MERIVYEQMAELDQRHWWYRARREVLAALIAPRRPACRSGRGSSRSAAAPGTISRCSASSAGSTRSSSTRRRAASPRSALGRPVMRAPLPEIDRRPGPHLRSDRRVRRDRAYRRRPGRDRLDRGQAQARRQAHHHRPRASVDVVAARRGEPSQAPLLEARRCARLIESSPLELHKIGYFNSLLFPLAVAERMVVKAVRGKDDADLKLPPAPLNAALEQVFAAERHLIARLPLPPGLSLFAVASAT